MNIIGQQIIRFFNGEKFIFEYIGNGDFKKIKGSRFIPDCIKEEIKSLGKNGV